MKDTYRAAATVDTAEPAATLTSQLLDGDSNRWMRVIYIKVLATMGACAAVSIGGSFWWTLLVAALGFAWMRGDIQNRQGPKLLFRVQNGRLTVHRDGAPDIEVGLQYLHNVRLDTKASSRDMTISRSDGVNSAFGMSSGHSIEFDVSRIELVTSTGTKLLSPAYLSNSRCTDELGKIRRFLRAQGWTPLDEREPQEAPPKKAKKSARA